MKSDRILMAHGGGGKAARELITEILLPGMGCAGSHGMDDGAVLPAVGGADIVFTTDSYVVQPLFFPGGDIGKLAVCGTVNDLAVMGAEAKYLSCAFIIEEGLLRADLERILRSMMSAAEEAGVRIVTGDTKVVERGAADGIFINTAGIGTRTAGVALGIDLIRAGDVIVSSGEIGAHGLAVMAKRASMPFSVGIESDCAPLNGMIREAMAAAGGIKFMRDMTRGGMATVMNEIAEEAGLGIEVDEKSVPINPDVAKFSEILGLDPIYMANEGKALFVCAPEDAEALVGALRRNKYGASAAVVGRVTESNPGKVILKTLIGGKRLLDMPSGEMLPRIC